MRRRKLLLTLTAIAAAGCYAALVYGPARQHEQNLQKLREMGVITTHAEMVAELSKGSKETAKLYREAEGLFNQIPKRTDAVSNWLGWKPEDGISKGEELRRPLEPIIAKVLEATAGDPPNWQRDWEWGALETESWIQESLSLAKIMVGEAKFQTAKGDYKQAIGGLAAIHSIGEHLASLPSLMDHLMGHAILIMHDAAALQVLDKFKREPVALNALEDYFEASPMMPSIREALRGDLYSGRSWLATRESLQEFLPSSKRSQLDPLVDWPYFRSAADRELTAIWRRAYEAFPENEEDSWKTEAAMQSASRSLGDPKTPNRMLVEMTFSRISLLGKTGVGRKPLAGYF